MKKGIFLIVSLLSLGALVGCNPSDDGEDLSINKNGESTVELESTIDQARVRLYELAQNQGFEITYKTDEDDSEEQTETIGYKNDLLWIGEDAAYKKIEGMIESYVYDAVGKVYEYSTAIAETAQFTMKSILDSATTSLYIGYSMFKASSIGAIVKEKATTFLGREAKEYSFSYQGANRSAGFYIYFDVQTGITLKVSASATDSDGETSFASFEIINFVVGAEVEIPALHRAE